MPTLPQPRHHSILHHFSCFLLLCFLSSCNGENSTVLDAAASSPSNPVNEESNSAPSEPTLSLFAGHLGGAGNADGKGVSAAFNGLAGITVSADGTIYVADTNNHTIRKITSNGTVTTLAGKAGVHGYVNGQGEDARFYHPTGIAVDGNGNVYVADMFNSAIRKIAPNNTVTTLAGSGNHDSVDGQGSAASFFEPADIAIDSGGNIYVADTYNNLIRKIAPNGLTSTIAGNVGITGSNDGQGRAASFNQPEGITVDSNGNIYVADTFNNTIRKITPDGSVTTLAGQIGIEGSADGQRANASFKQPIGITVDVNGSIYVADTLNSTIRKITPDGTVTTLAGRAIATGSADGQGTAATFRLPSGIAVNPEGGLYVADTFNNLIRKITPTLNVSTLAGQAAVFGSTDGKGAAASFAFPFGLTKDANDNIYVADVHNNVIRKITPDGAVSTLAGKAGFYGSVDGQGAAARFFVPMGVAAGANGTIYVADSFYGIIRKITPDGTVTTLAGQAGVAGSADGQGETASFVMPQSLAVDTFGNILVADIGGNLIRKITPDGTVSTLAGSGLLSSADGQGVNASFFEPSGIGVDAYDNIYVADLGSNLIRKITPNGTVSTIAGQAGVTGFTDGNGTVATFNKPTAITVSPSGIVFVSDTGNNTIRKLTPNGNGYLVSTIIGSPGKEGVQLGTLPASLSSPTGITINRSGNLMVVSNNAVLIAKQPGDF